MKSFFSALFVLFFVASVFAATGSLDSTFGINGVRTVFINGSDMARDVIIQPDGKIIIAGTSQIAGNQDFSLSRLNSDGTVDTSFGTNGKVLTPFNNFDSLDNAWAAALQTDGKIVLAGTYSNGSGSLVALARYNSNGSLDTSFDSDGKVTASVGFLSSISSVAIQSDGKIVVAGTFISNPGGSDFIAVRFNTDGTLDTSFDNDGIVITPVGTSGEQAYSIAIQPDGKIILGGYAFTGGGNSGFALVRYNTDGSLDTTFGIGGKVINAVNNTPGQDRIYSLIIQPDGKIVGVGVSITGVIDSALARYNYNGSLDNSFGIGGKVITSISTRDDLLSDVALQADGKLAVSGYAWASQTNYDFVAGRYNSDGTLDSSFGIGGLAITSLSNGEDRANAISVQADGKIITVGTGSGGFIITRYPINGLRNVDFDGDGKSDISVYRPSNGAWYLQNSSTGFYGEIFGAPEDKIVPADYDGDDKTDIAVYRQGAWYLQRSRDGFYGINWGAPEDIPAPADYDGDGRCDIAVYRPSTGSWYIYNITTGQFTGYKFGAAKDKPIAADYDGDGRADVAVFRPSEAAWYIQRSRDGFMGRYFGVGTDIPIPADYDGDGKADVAVYRPDNSSWYLQTSRDGFKGYLYGAAGDLPVPADYDGDGKTDIGVFRPSEGAWYLETTKDGFKGMLFGTGTDKPTPYSFVL